MNQENYGISGTGTGKTSHKVNKNCICTYRVSNLLNRRSTVSVCLGERIDLEWPAVSWRTRSWLGLHKHFRSDN